MGNLNVKAGFPAQRTNVQRVCLENDLHANMEMRMYNVATGHRCLVTGEYPIYNERCLNVRDCAGMNQGDEFEIEFRAVGGKTVNSKHRYRYQETDGQTIDFRSWGDLVNGYVDVQRVVAASTFYQCSNFYAENFCEERCGWPFYPHCGIVTMWENDFGNWDNPFTGERSLRNPSCHEYFQDPFTDVCERYVCDCAGCNGCPLHDPLN